MPITAPSPAGGARRSRLLDEDERTADPLPGTIRPGPLPVPCLTVLAHPDPDRVGARAALAELEELVPGRGIELSRAAPCFARPGSLLAAPLADRHLSRTPVWLLAGAAAGGVRIVRGDSAMDVEIGGAPLRAERELSAQQLEDGVVMLLGRRVALVLHRGAGAPDASGLRHGLVGESRAMLRLRRGIGQVAAACVPVLLRGESGTGKELVARAVHDASPRRDRPYVAVNMAAIPPALAAAELFGAARGAFTGADQERAGYFGRAHGGTLFLDEIGEAGPEVQALLLRALETGEIQTVGSLAPRRVDVRVIAATDADLERLMVTDRFRAPLFHRLAAGSLHVPPLRARRDDIGRLLYAFLEEELAAAGAGDRLRAGPAGTPWLPAPLVAQLAALPWPGNVRQLRNCARALVVAARDATEVTLDDLEDVLAGAAAARAPRSPAPPSPAPASPAPASPAPASPAPRRAYRAAAAISEDELLAALRKHRFRLTPAASELGIARTSLYALLERCPGVRKAGDLGLGEIERELARAGGDVDAAGDVLGVSRHGLLLRLHELRAAAAPGTPGEP